MVVSTSGDCARSAPTVAVLLRGVRERVEPEVPRGVLPRDLVDLVVGDAGAFHLAHHGLGRVGPDRIGVWVVALPGDDVDPDVVAHLERHGVAHVTGERVVAEDVARHLVAEVVTQPALVHVVTVAPIEEEGDPTDAGFGPRDLEVG